MISCWPWRSSLVCMCVCVCVWKSLGCVWLFVTSWNSLGQNTGVSSCSLLQGIFPTQGSNPGLPHCRLILYCLSYQGSPEEANYRVIERVMCQSETPLGSEGPMYSITSRHNCKALNSSSNQWPWKRNLMLIFDHSPGWSWLQLCEALNRGPS